MRLVKLAQGRFTVVARVEDGEQSKVQDFLSSVQADMQASAQGMYVLFERYAQGGRQNLTSSLFHEANKQEGIWEFIKGRLRVFCFIDSTGQLVVLSHGAIKKSQKADSREVACAVTLKIDYEAAHREGSIQLIELTTGVNNERT